MTKTTLTSILKAGSAIGFGLTFAHGMELDEASNSPHFPSLEMDLRRKTPSPFGYSGEAFDANSFPILDPDYVAQSFDPYAYSERTTKSPVVYTGIKTASKLAVHAPKCRKFKNAPLLPIADLTEPPIDVTHLTMEEQLENAINLDMSGTSTLLLEALTKTPNLNSLDLRGRGIGDEGIQYIARLTTLKNLQHLNLSGNNISDQGIYSLTKSRTLLKLKSLDLSYNSIGNEGAYDIESSPLFSNLTYLNLVGNNIGMAEKIRIFNKFPLVKFQ